MRNAMQNQPEQIIQNKLATIQRRMRIESVFQNLAIFNLWGLLIAGILLFCQPIFSVADTDWICNCPADNRCECHCDWL